MFPTFEPRRRAISYHGDARYDRELADRNEQDERRKKIDDLIYNLDSPTRGERAAAIEELSSMLEEPIGYFHHARITDALCVCTTLTAAQGRKFAMECIEASKNAIKEERLQFGTNARQVFDDFIARATEELTLALQNEEAVDKNRALKEENRYKVGNTLTEGSITHGLSELAEEEEEEEEEGDYEMSQAMETDDELPIYEEEGLQDENADDASLSDSSSTLSELGTISTPSPIGSVHSTHTVTARVTTPSPTLEAAGPSSSEDSLANRITTSSSNAPSAHRFQTDLSISHDGDWEYGINPQVNVVLQSVFDLLMRTGDLEGMRVVLMEFASERGITGVGGLHDDGQESQGEDSEEDD
ncbi:hypothetical protein BP6252_00813 [Coleophoma cylindrospora]|uniref:Uncharacterized protein n=1 Tax=Coleophoma cylindrospora TaxID=1849047 RepID=A0A3D8SRI5_9HELO|nr:hypothetical protein BP6252_00813 [Coleophoma cylindrospora]